MKHRETMYGNKRISDCMKQIDNLTLCMTKEKPLERIRALEQKINEVEKISNLEDAINQIKKELWSTKEVLSSSEVCAFLGISESYLYRLTSLKQIPHYKPNGKMIFFNRKEICEWILRNPAKVVESSPTINTIAL